MVKETKRPKKKASPKLTGGNDATNSSTTQNKLNQASQSSQQSHNTSKPGQKSSFQEKGKQQTPMQIEQTELAMQLDHYISEFQQKLLRLKSAPSPREAVILFIMNLHPRWRRFVEPAEPSFSSWEAAAKLAQLHCSRVSAILGCARNGSSSINIFNTPETRALIDSGYFVSSSSLSASKYPGATAIRHLLTTTKAEKSESSSTSTKVQEKPAKLAIVQSSKEVANVSTAKQVTKASVEPTRAVKVSSTDVLLPEPSKSSEEDLKETIYIEQTHKTDKEQQQQQQQKNGEPSSSKKPSVSTSSPLTTITPPLVSGNAPVTKSKSQSSTKAAKREVSNNTQLSMPAQTDIESSQNSPNTSYYHNPPEPTNTNLSFLELTINDKRVKGLLDKKNWKCSAISQNCTNSLGIDVQPSENKDLAGIAVITIAHPVDPSIIVERKIQVLPEIYGGKIELVLGADFYPQSQLNIKSRTIKILGKEAPYIVNTLE